MGGKEAPEPPEPPGTVPGAWCWQDALGLTPANRKPRKKAGGTTMGGRGEPEPPEPPGIALGAWHKQSMLSRPYIGLFKNEIRSHRHDHTL